MKKMQILCVAGVAFIVLLAARGLGQTASKVNVTGSEVNHGVVIVTVQKSAKSFELHCNEGMTACKALAKGVFTLVVLPENWGMYECKDVEVYPETPESQMPAKEKKLGEYCLVEPK
jgi:hypothetical protein